MVNCRPRSSVHTRTARRRKFGSKVRQKLRHEVVGHGGQNATERAGPPLLRPDKLIERAPFDHGDSIGSLFGLVVAGPEYHDQSREGE
jgi:hypothetical protein